MGEIWAVSPEMTEEDESFIEQLVMEKLNLICADSQKGVEGMALDLCSTCNNDKNMNSYNQRQQVIKWICDTYFKSFIKAQKEFTQNKMPYKTNFVSDNYFGLNMKENVITYEESKGNQNTNDSILQHEETKEENKDDIHDKNISIDHPNTTSPMENIESETDRMSNEVNINRHESRIIHDNTVTMKGDICDDSADTEVNKNLKAYELQDTKDSHVQNKQTKEENKVDHNKKNKSIANLENIHIKTDMPHEMSINRHECRNFEQQNKQNYDEINNEFPKKSCLNKNSSTLAKKIYEEIERRANEGKISKTNGGEFILEKNDMITKHSENVKTSKQESNTMLSTNLTQNKQQTYEVKQYFNVKNSANKILNLSVCDKSICNKDGIKRCSLEHEKLSQEGMKLNFQEDIKIYKASKYKQDFNPAGTSNSYIGKSKDNTNYSQNHAKNEMKRTKSENDSKRDETYKITIENNYYKSKSPCKRQDYKRLPPMMDKHSPYYIDNKIVPRFIYEDGLTLKKWNPTQVMYEICSQCNWPPPEFVEEDYTMEKGFLFSVRVKDRDFIPRQRGRTKKEAKHYASSHFLRYLGFEVSFEYKKTTVPDILGHINGYNSFRSNHTSGRDRSHNHTYFPHNHFSTTIKEEKEHNINHFAHCKKHNTHKYIHTSLSYYPEPVKREYKNLSSNQSISWDASPNSSGAHKPEWTKQYHYHDTEKILRRGIKRDISQTHSSDSDEGHLTSGKNFKKKYPNHTHDKNYPTHSSIKQENESYKKYKHSRKSHVYTRKIFDIKREPAYLVDPCTHDTF